MSEKDRIAPPPHGFFRWILPLFSTPNAELISNAPQSLHNVRYTRRPDPHTYRQCSNPDVKGLGRYGRQNYDRANTENFLAYLILTVLILTPMHNITMEEWLGIFIGWILLEHRLEFFS
jgi:hypothetical protein